MKSKQKRFNFRVEAEFANGEKKWLFWPVWANDFDEAFDSVLAEAKKDKMVVTDICYSPSRRSQK